MLGSEDSLSGGGDTTSPCWISLCDGETVLEVGQKGDVLQGPLIVLSDEFQRLVYNITEPEC